MIDSLKIETGSKLADKYEELKRNYKQDIKKWSD